MEIIEPSWHYTVDNTEIWQSIPINENYGTLVMDKQWEIVGRFLLKFVAKIQMEIMHNRKKMQHILAARLLYECSLPSDAIRMHRDWSGKTVHIIL